jgi:hypothetical protein
MKEQDEIKDLFKDSFDGFEVTPPASVKINIDQKISQIQSRRKLKWFFYAGISALVLVLTVLLFKQSQNKVTTTNLASNGISQYDDQSSNRISQYGDKAKACETSEIECKLNSLGKANQNIHKTSNSSENSKTSFEKTGTKTSKQLDNKIKKQKIDNQKKIKNTLANSNTKITSKSKTKISKTKKKKTKKRNNKYQIKKIKPEEIKPVLYENEYRVRIEDDVDGRETIVANIEKNNGEQKTLIDSNTISNIDSLQLIVNDSLEENEQLIEIEKAKRPWLFSLKTGTSLGFNKVNGQSTFSLKEKSSFFIQTEFAYYLNSKMAISSGFNYQNNFENISQDQKIINDSAIVSYDVSLIYDSMQNVIDSIVIPIYGVDTSIINASNSYQVYSIGLPIMFQYTFEFNPKLFLDLSAGAILNLQGSRTNYEYLNTSSRTVNQFGAKACLRSQLRYQFSNWGVSLNTNFGYDFKPIQSWENINRKRSYLDLGIGLHYMIK